MSASSDPHTSANEPARRVGKSATAFRTISEAASELDLPQHVLRFWESKFPQIRPMKRGGGRRYYRPEDMDLLRRIRSLLYDDGYTIKGVQKILRDPHARNAALADDDGPDDTIPEESLVQSESVAALPASGEREAMHGDAVDRLNRAELRAILDELQAIRRLL